MLERTSAQICQAQLLLGIRTVHTSSVEEACAGRDAYKENTTGDIKYPVK